MGGGWRGGGGGRAAVGCGGLTAGAVTGMDRCETCGKECRDEPRQHPETMRVSKTQTCHEREKVCVRSVPSRLSNGGVGCAVLGHVMVCTLLRTSDTALEDTCVLLPCRAHAACTSHPTQGGRVGGIPAGAVALHPEVLSFGKVCLLKRRYTLPRQRTAVCMQSPDMLWSAGREPPHDIDTF